MSTYWYFVCLSHDPNLSEDEFTQHTDDDAFKAALKLANTRPLNEDFEPDEDDYFGMNAARFLRQHPYCELAIRNEYGERRTGLRELRAKEKPVTWTIPTAGEIYAKAFEAETDRPVTITKEQLKIRLYELGFQDHLYKSLRERVIDAWAVEILLGHFGSHK